MDRRKPTLISLALTLALLPTALSWRVVSPAAEASANHDNGRSTERGAYLVRIMGCNDCHTPWTLGPKGPAPDMSRALTGHPADVSMPPAPPLPPGNWQWIAAVHEHGVCRTVGCELRRKPHPRS